MRTVFGIVLRQLLPGTADDLQPGNKSGYSCRACHKALQASPSVLERMATIPPGVEIRIFCQDCGLLFAQGVAEKGKLDGVEFTSKFMEQWAGRGDKRRQN